MTKLTEASIIASIDQWMEHPSPEGWASIVQLGKQIRKTQKDFWPLFEAQVGGGSDFKHWPPEIERLCPAGWPREFKEAVEHRIRETDTYGHYIAKICGHPDLKLSDGSQAVWLERRFTGGAVHVSTVKAALRALSQALATQNWHAVEAAQRCLMGGVKQIGKVGCADLTGGVVIERNGCQSCWHPYDPKYDKTKCAVCKGFHVIRHEYRLEVEVKVGDEPQRPEQLLRMRSVQSRGGCYVLCRSVEEAVQQIKKFREGK